MVLTEDILLLPLVLHGETVSDEVVEPFKVLLKTGIRENDNASIGCITREEEMVPSILLVFHIHRVDGLHAVEGLPDDGLPVTPTLPLTSAVIKDDHSSVVRGIEVVQDIPIRSGQGLQKTRFHHPFPVVVLLPENFNLKSQSGQDLSPGQRI